MQFALICRDSKTAGTLERRLSVREQHMEQIHAMKADGRILDGGAILGDDGQMCGSVVLCEFEDRAALDAYLASEVYALNGVWGEIDILPFRRVAWRDGK